MIIAARGTAQNHAMWVESSCRNRASSVLLQEARVWFHARELVAVKVEDLDNMIGCSTAELVRCEQ